MTRRGLRFASVLLAVVLFAAVAAQPGIAGTVSVASGTLSYSGSGGMSVTIDLVEVQMPFERYYRVTDGNGVTAGTSCEQTNSFEVRCNTGIGGVAVSAIDVSDTSADDVIRLTANVVVPATIRDFGGEDEFIGGSGNDSFVVSVCDAEPDVFSGGAGNDILNSCDGNDWLNGGPGDDMLEDHYGVNTFNGAENDDTIYSRDNDGTTVDNVDCGPGENDRVTEDGDNLTGCEFVAPRSTSPPMLSGTALEGETLTVTTGVWMGTPMTFSYSWERCNLVLFCTPIAGATNQTYALTAADVDRRIKAAVTATNVAGSETRYSSQTSLVQPSAPRNDGDCTIQGTSGNDTLIGTRGNDIICAGTGKDIVRGLGGNDVIRLGAGNDKGYGGAGKDRILGAVGRDLLVGGKGRDILNGGRGRDTCLGARDIRRSC